MELQFRVPYGANGWQLCMGLYAMAYGAGMLWPELAGAADFYRRLGAVGFDPQLFGLVALAHGAAAVVALFAFGGRSYWCPMMCALGALIWTLIGLSQIAISLGDGVGLPVWGAFELLGGVGYSVATVQRARDPVVQPEA